MAKKTTIKKYYRSRNRWSPNIAEFSSNSGALQANAIFHVDSTLATNPSQSTLGVSQVYTVKNFEISFEFEQTGNPAIENLTAYIMFLPQGMLAQNNFNIEHPEYIMAYQFYGSAATDTNNNRNTRRIKTRMARKLNTGDSVILLIKGINKSSGPGAFEIRGLVRWWTKAN